MSEMSWPAPYNNRPEPQKSLGLGLQVYTVVPPALGMEPSLPLDVVAGSNTAVFVGSFTSDYQQMSIKDPNFRHNYAATGVDPGIISNRFGNTFNLVGPSHDCDAIAGGVNLILTVDQHMNTAKLGILSPTSTCHTFDAATDG
ncbi:MAG: hypothetical protein Q9181_002691 [Wetmoreana brouardii]